MSKGERGRALKVRTRGVVAVGLVVGKEEEVEEGEGGLIERMRRQVGLCAFQCERWHSGEQ